MPIEPTKKASSLLKAMQEACSVKGVKNAPQHLKNHHLSAKTSKTLSRMFALMDEGTTFDTFLNTLLETALSSQDRRDLDAVSEEDVARVHGLLFRKPYPGFGGKAKNKKLLPTGTET